MNAMIPFCTPGGSGISTAESNLHAMTDDTVQWLTGARFAAGTSKDRQFAGMDRRFRGNGMKIVVLEGSPNKKRLV